MGVAIAGLLLSVVNSAWNVAKHRQDGSRLVVRLKPAVLSIEGHLVRGPEGGWRDHRPDELAPTPGHPHVDLAVIEVANVGRTPVTVTNLGLDLGPTGWRRRHHTICCRAIPLFEGIADSGSVRIEGQSAVCVIVDHRSALSHVQGVRKGRRLPIRATALRPSGRPSRSAWRHRWSTTKPERHTWPVAPQLADDVEAFGKVFRLVSRFPPVNIYETWIDLNALYLQDHAPTLDEIASVLSDATSADTLSQVFFVAADLHRTYNGPTRLHKVLSGASTSGST